MTDSVIVYDLRSFPLFHREVHSCNSVIEGIPTKVITIELSKST